MDYEDEIDRYVRDMVSDAQKISIDLSRALGELKRLFEIEEINLLGALEILKNINNYLGNAEARVYRLDFLDDCIDVLLVCSDEIESPYSQIQEELWSFLFDSRSGIVDWKGSIDNLLIELRTKDCVKEKDLGIRIPDMENVIAITKDMLKLLETIHRP